MLRFHLANKREQQQFDHLSGPIEFGRGPERNGVPRCVIQDLYVSKDHLHITELDGGLVRVENLSQRNSVRLGESTFIGIGETRNLQSPAQLTVGETVLSVEHVREEDEAGPLETLAAPRSGHKVAPHSLLDLGRTPTPQTLTHWFETLIAVQRSAAGSPEFYSQTARAVVSLVGLDKGLVILRRNGRWMVQARCPDDGDSLGREFSLTILERVAKERRTFFQSAPNAGSATESLKGVEAVVASPIFDPHDQVVGVVYGCRTRFTASNGLGIGHLEAQVIQLLASAVGSGLARQEQEAEAGRLRVQFEQFFSADLARELEKNPRLLDGQEREITVLFSDIRGFSRLAERLGPTDTCRLVSDVMEDLTTRVREFEGVVVDYSGDGIMAMWNAPASQVDHATKACKAALAMLADLPQLDSQWKDRLGEPLRLGIGLNTGPALCGNTGSKLKFKYGPLGHAVNLASRVEGATKLLGIPLLITGSTRAQLGDGFATRRLCRVRVFGVAEAVDLYELHAETAPPAWHKWRETYETALGLFEVGKCTAAWQALNTLIDPLDTNHDVPTLDLMERIVQVLKSPPAQFDGVFDLHSK